MQSRSFIQKEHRNQTDYRIASVHLQNRGEEWKDFFLFFSCKRLPERKKFVSLPAKIKKAKANRIKSL
jgi:hypothetical protein